MQITEDNRPKCKYFDQCGKLGLFLMGKDWVCGTCVNKYLSAAEKLRDKIILEEHGQSK
jgi:hypothetical protein